MCPVQIRRITASANLLWGMGQPFRGREDFLPIKYHYTKLLVNVSWGNWWRKGHGRHYSIKGRVLMSCLYDICYTIQFRKSRQEVVRITKKEEVNHSIRL